MDMQPGAFKALIDDLTQWRGLVLTTIENNACLDRDAVVRGVLGGADDVLARLSMAPNGASLAEPIEQALELFYRHKRDGERRVFELPRSQRGQGDGQPINSTVWRKRFQIPGQSISAAEVEKLRNQDLNDRRNCLELVANRITVALSALATFIEPLPLRPAWLVQGRNKDVKLVVKPSGEEFEESYEGKVRVSPIYATYFDGRPQQRTQFTRKTLTRNRYVLTESEAELVREFCPNGDLTKPNIARIEAVLMAHLGQPADQIRNMIQNTFSLLESLKRRQRFLESATSTDSGARVRPPRIPDPQGVKLCLESPPETARPSDANTREIREGGIGHEIVALARTILTDIEHAEACFAEMDRVRSEAATALIASYSERGVEDEFANCVFADSRLAHDEAKEQLTSARQGLELLRRHVVRNWPTRFPVFAQYAQGNRDVNRDELQRELAVLANLIEHHELTEADPAGQTDPKRLTQLETYPNNLRGHLGFVEWVCKEVCDQAHYVKNRTYPDASFPNAIAGIRVQEALERIRLLPNGLSEQTQNVASVLRREVTMHTVEGVAKRLKPAVTALRDAAEGWRQRDESQLTIGVDEPKSTPSTTQVNETLIDDEAAAAAEYRALLMSVKSLAKNRLVGKQRRIVELLVEAGGRKRIADVATDSQVCWDRPYKTGVDGFKKGIKPKLTSLGAAVVVVDNELRIVRTCEAPKQRQRKAKTLTRKRY